ncbi:MAG: transglycosylase SLT domain-containing protein [Gammaproteobacteria bacterium]|nr:transglycosylase SLT domain-containing protein [Gammaproteobacteria bacterium]
MLLLAAPLWGGELPVHEGNWSDEYDHYFRKYTKRYFGPYYDWRWFKSQAIVESNLQPGVRSPRGAVGVMQLLPSTFDEIKKRHPHFVSVEEPRWNIAAGIYYDRTLYRKWELPSEQDRLYLSLASYNAGYVRMRRAYRRTAPPVESWEQVEPQAPLETRDYVQRIRALMDAEAPKQRSPLRGVARLLGEREVL